jgi:phosphatidylserine/phosphatidylglycerophosphate/cardiolipin synthase-like enzyme
LLLALGTGAAPCVASAPALQAAFAPWDDIGALIVGTVDGARRQVLVQAYLLTSKPITEALIRAHRRGVDVRVLLDEKQMERAGSAMAARLAAAGVPVWLETAYQNAHNKLMVIDAATAGATVITGSYNFTWTAQHRNAENILIARQHPALAARYAANWERHRQDAVAFKK